MDPGKSSGKKIHTAVKKKSLKKAAAKAAKNSRNGRGKNSVTSAEINAQFSAINRAFAFITYYVQGSIDEANDIFLTSMGYIKDRRVRQHHVLPVEKSYAQSEEYKTFWSDLAKSKPRTGEFKLFNSQGEIVWPSAPYSPVKDEFGKLGNGFVGTYPDKTMSIVFLKGPFNRRSGNAASAEKNLHKSYDATLPEETPDLVIVSYNGRTIGFVVDKLLRQKEIVEKPLSKPLNVAHWIGGVTIMGNGHVCLVVNIAAICNMIFARGLKNISVN